MKSNRPEITFGWSSAALFLIMRFANRSHTQKLQVEASIFKMGIPHNYNAVYVTVLVFYVVIYALFVFSVHAYYVNCNAKTQMGY